jgi:hypothetical protein
MSSKYVNPPRFDPEDLQGVVDPYAGFLCMSVHWRPVPDAPDSEIPGEKLSMSSYIPVHPAEECLCGSGKRYGDCCQLRPLWHPICPNPGGPDKGFSLTRPQTARFRNVDGDALCERLMADRQLHCTDDSPASRFWLYWGDPPIEEQYGILCFGDVELKGNRTLVVTAMSELRMQVLLALLRDIAGDLLEEPRITYDDIPMIDKQTGKARTQRAAPASRVRGRRRRRKR